MFDFFKRKTIPDRLSDIKTKHIKAIIDREGAERAGKILRQAAVEGSTDCAAFLSAMLSAHVAPGEYDAAPKRILEEFLFYTEMAAKQGDASSQWNIAKYYASISMSADKTMSESGYENLKKAMVWYERSAAQGFKPALQSLSEIGEVFQWAERTFGTKENNT